MRTVIFPNGTKKFFDCQRYDVGEWYQSWSEKWHIITSCEPGEAQDMDGQIDRGFLYTMREPTREETAKREHQQAEWEALTPEERTEKRIDKLSDLFRNLDWGD